MNSMNMSQPGGGGLASAARHLQAQGRGEDTALIHMTPGEVKGLQALAVAHGGSLTINPTTGLPEAGFLKNLLPTLIGAGLMLIPGVNAIAAPWMIGAGVGGFEALRTGDLGKGLMAGLGAFGGAGLTSALSAAGAASAAPSAMSVPGQAGGSLLADVAAHTGAEALLPTAGQMSMAPGSQSLAQAMGAGAGSAGSVGSPLAMTLEQGIAAQQAAAQPSLANMGAGLQNLANPGGVRQFGSAFVDATGGKMGAGLAGAGLAAPLMQQEPIEFPEPEKSNYAGPYKPSERQVRYPTDRDPYDSSEFSYFSPSNPFPYAKGGKVGLEDGSFIVDARTVSEIGNGSSNAGQEYLAKFGGVPIKGPGDGVSDSIKASIGGAQPARVARDEVKFEPKAVKQLGGGNAKRGTAKLYAMMDQAHKARKEAQRGEDTGLRALMSA